MNKSLNESIRLFRVQELAADAWGVPSYHIQVHRGPEGLHVWDSQKSLAHSFSVVPEGATSGDVYTDAIDYFRSERLLRQVGLEGLGG